MDDAPVSKRRIVTAFANKFVADSENLSKHFPPESQIFQMHDEDEIDPENFPPESHFYMRDEDIFQ